MTNPDFTLEPAQEIGMALAHSRKVTDALERAAAAGAIVLTRESTQELLEDVDRAIGEFGSENPSWPTLENVRDFLADALGTK